LVRLEWLGYRVSRARIEVKTDMQADVRRHAFPMRFHPPISWPSFVEIQQKAHGKKPPQKNVSHEVNKNDVP
jgi:hypothetical protein